MQKSDDRFWRISLAHLLTTLGTSNQGLTRHEAANRLKKGGQNMIAPPKQRIFYDILSRFKNPIILLLLIIALMAFFLGQKNDCLIIAAMIFLSVFLDFFQENSAHHAVEKLQASVAITADVLRDAHFKEIPVKDIVCGDIVRLKAGDMVPADGRLIWDNHLFVNQGILTGESFPVEKIAMDLTDSPHVKGEIEEATNSLFMGTSVINGEGHMVVCHTGSRACLGTIAESLKKAHPPSQFELDMRHLGFFLMRITIFLVLFTFMVNLLLQRPWLETFMFSLALAVGMTPEFLPVVISVALSRGAVNMAKKSVVVKTLASIHDLGRMDLLCTDKTGTLTKAKIHLASSLDGQGENSEKVLWLAYLNSFFQTGLKSPLDAAIVKQGHFNTDVWTKIDEIPFAFERKRVSVLLEQDQERLLIVKGAPEEIINCCTSYEHKGTIRALTPSFRTKLLKLYTHHAEKGFRILGVAWQKMTKNAEKDVSDDETHLIFSGFTLFYDPPKKETSVTLKKLKKQHVEIYILTGDSEEVTLHLCRKLKFPVQGVLTGKMLDTLDDLALEAQVRETNIYCRVTPQQKQRIILALKKIGHVVGFLGDGINDAPALHSAHIGISVDTAADVAKEAADLILRKHHLGVIYDAIREGRKIYSVIVKYVMMMTSANFGNMLSMASASLILPFLPMLPTQILLNNFLYDTSQMAIPFDHVDAQSILTPQKWNLRFLLKFMLVMGPLSSIFDFMTFVILLIVMQASPALFQTGWFIESLATQILIVFIIRTRLSIFHSKPHIFLTVLSSFLVGVGVLLPYTPLGPIFGFVSPPLLFLMVLVGIVCLYLTTAEKVKLWFYQKFG